MKANSYKSEVQKKNIAWFLPRPKPDKYRGGMPLHCEKWLIDLAKDILENNDPKILHLFSGMCQDGYRIDLNPEVKPDIIADAHTFTEYVKSKFDLIIADPPYSTEESKELYGTGKLNYKQWTEQCDKVLEDGGLLVVYHKYVMPNPNPKKYEVAKRVFIGNRTYHLPRVAVYFRKKTMFKLDFTSKND